LLVLLSFGSAAAALDLKKVKVPKQPEESVPLTGVKNGLFGVYGTLFRFAAGNLALQVTADGCFVAGNVSNNFDVSVTQNCAPLGSGVSGHTWMRVDCDADF
jgi:hypothetical protein